ncbi:MAG: D-alanine--D-alanine ligase [Proteobacteria bacterium]|nr:D-alanine--D-alanine ligase [Pseudomonadota bacterium]MBU4010199.1 D-alanine--D-alanine ligase [Pseudomonadota bacterium]
MKKTVGILHADISDKADEDEKDALIQLEAVSKALTQLGFDPVSVKFDLNLEAVGIRLQKLNPAFVFNLVESVNGCGSLIHLAPSFLDYLKIVYTGSKTQAMFLTSNKLLGKDYLAANDINTSKAYCLSTLKKETSVNGRFIIKSVWEHASIGMSQDSVVYVKSASELIAKLERFKSSMSGDFFCEEYIDGREFNIALLSGPEGVEVLPPAEILFTDYPSDKLKIVDYSAKWKTDSFEYLNTNRTFNFTSDDSYLIESLKIISKECWDLFGLKGYARVDFRIDESGRPWVLEINANPCISPDSGFAAASKMIGLAFPEIIKRIIEDI